NLFRPGKVVDSFEHVTSATEGQLGQSLQALFQTGDEIQRRILDMLLGASSLNGGAATSGSNRPAPVSASPGPPPQTLPVPGAVPAPSGWSAMPVSGSVVTQPAPGAK